MSTLFNRRKNSSTMYSYKLKRIREMFEFRVWQYRILVRDSFTCVVCGRCEKNMNVHHIISVRNIVRNYNINTLKDALNCEILWDLHNGVSLCSKCHNNIKNININKYTDIINCRTDIISKLCTKINNNYSDYYLNLLI